MQTRFIAVVASIGCAFVSSIAFAKKEAPPPPGVKVIAGNFFAVYVQKTEEKPAPANYVARVFSVVVVAQTTKHGTQRFTKRIETLDADLLESKNWEAADLDNDGRDDLRYLAQQTKAGCKVWPALRWEKERERFTQGGPELAREVDANGKKTKCR